MAQADPLRQKASDLASELLSQWTAADPLRSASVEALKSSTKADYKCYFSNFLYFLLARRKTFDMRSLDDIFMFLRALVQEKPSRRFLSSSATAIRWYFRHFPKPQLANDKRWSSVLSELYAPLPPLLPRNRERPAQNPAVTQGSSAGKPEKKHIK
jgi:hypothetical protein